MRRELSAVWLILKRDLQLRYRQTFLGVLWLIAPLFGLAFFMTVLGDSLGFYAPGQSSSYVASLLVGLVVWQLFVETWSEPARLGRRARSLLGDVVFDPVILVWAGTLSAAMSFSARIVLLTPFVIFVGLVPTVPLYYMLISIVTVIVAGVVFAYLTTPLCLSSRDFRYGLPYFQAFLLLTIPLIYGSVSIDLGFLTSKLNPLSNLIMPIPNWISGKEFELTRVATTLGAFLLLTWPALAYFRAKFGLALAYARQ